MIRNFSLDVDWVVVKQIFQKIQIRDTQSFNTRDLIISCFQSCYSYCFDERVSLKYEIARPVLNFVTAS
jgi:hypothetical protein